MKRRHWLKLALASTSASALGNAFLIEPKLCSITQHSVTLPNCPPALRGLKLVVLGDFHFKPSTNLDFVRKIVAQTNSLQPDLILLVGDYIDYDLHVLPRLLDELRHLRAQHGIFGCLGNHDRWAATATEYKHSFQHTGIRLLVNENIQLSIHGERLFLAATDCIWGGQPDPEATLSGIPRNAPLITLVHEPDYFDTMVQHHRAHLQLSGHTHGGQCRVPLIGYSPIKVKYGKNYIYGRFQCGDSQLFVTRGIGTTSLPVRFSCRPEIAQLTLD